MNILGGTIALLLQDHRTMTTKTVCSSQYMVTDQHWATDAQIKHSYVHWWWLSVSGRHSDDSEQVCLSLCIGLIQNTTGARTWLYSGGWRVGAYFNPWRPGVELAETAV